MNFKLISVVARLCFAASYLLLYVAAMSLGSEEDALAHRNRRAAIDVHVEEDPGRPYYIKHGCERTLLNITCQLSHQQILTVHATYGRQDASICSEHSLYSKDLAKTCPIFSTRRATRIISARCNGRNSCVIPVVNMLFGDPCPNTYKYVEVYYACVDGTRAHFPPIPHLDH